MNIMLCMHVRICVCVCMCVCLYVNACIIVYMRHTCLNGNNVCCNCHLLYALHTKVCNYIWPLYQSCRPLNLLEYGFRSLGLETKVPAVLATCSLGLGYGRPVLSLDCQCEQ